MQTSVKENGVDRQTTGFDEHLRSVIVANDLDQCSRWLESRYPLLSLLATIKPVLRKHWARNIWSALLIEHRNGMSMWDNRCFSSDRSRSKKVNKKTEDRLTNRRLFFPSRKSIWSDHQRSFLFMSVGRSSASTHEVSWSSTECLLFRRGKWSDRK